jgi:hypothetical protein
MIPANPAIILNIQGEVSFSDDEAKVNDFNKNSLKKYLLSTTVADGFPFLLKIVKNGGVL